MTINQILNEAADFTTADAIIEAIKNGKTEVSPKKFFSINSSSNTKNINSEIEKAKENFTSIINSCKEYNIDNKAIKLIIKRAGDIVTFNNNYKGFDPYVAYFKNKDKKEAQTTYKKLFDDFVNSQMNPVTDHNFEKEVDKLFSQKTNIKNKNKEINHLYGPDKDGWEVFIPLTFAAASNYSTTKDGKTKWCTAARKSAFDTYSGYGPLWIIRNYDKGLAYQLNLNSEDKKYVQFMDKDDEEPSAEELVKTIKIIPEEALKTINFHGRNLLEFKQLVNKKEGKEKPTSYTPFKTETIGKWKKETVNLNTPDDIKKYSGLNIPSANTATKILENFYNGLENQLRTKESKIGQVDIYTKDNKTFYWVTHSNRFRTSNVVVKVNYQNTTSETLPDEKVPKDLFNIIHKGKVDHPKEEAKEIFSNSDYTITVKKTQEEWLRKYNKSAVYTVNFKNPIYAETEYKFGLAAPSFNSIIYDEGNKSISVPVMNKRDGKYKKEIDKINFNDLYLYKFNPEKIFYEALSRVAPDFKNTMVNNALRENPSINPGASKERAKQIADTIKRVRSNITPVRNNDGGYK